MTIYDVDIDALTGGPAGPDRHRGPVARVVNVAARCGGTVAGRFEQLLPR